MQATRNTVRTLLLCFALAPAWAQSGASLLIREARPQPADSGSSIVFDPAEPDPAASRPATADLEKLVHARAGNLTVYIDPAAETDKWHTRVIYQAFVSDGSTVAPLRLTATPHGKFPPQRLSLDFVASLGAAKDQSGSIELPVFALKTPQYLQVAPCSNQPQSVALTGVSTVCVQLTNLLDNLDIVYEGAPEIQPNPQFWEEVTPKLSETRLELRVRPRFGAAVSASLLQNFSSNSQISGVIHYRATHTPVALAPSIPFSVPVEFFPGLAQLCLAAMAGAFLGAFLRSTAHDIPLLKGRHWRSSVAVMVLAVVFEVVGLKTQSGLAIGGATFTVSSLVPACLLGMVVGAAGLKKAMEKFDKAAGIAGEPEGQPAGGTS